MSHADWWAAKRWEIAEATGWTLEYIDALSLEDLYQWDSVQDARAKLIKTRRPAPAARGGRRRR